MIYPVINGTAVVDFTQLSKEQFFKFYKDCFRKWLTYSPDEIGSQDYAITLGELDYTRPEWVEEIEAELEAENESATD
jgi:hypothetical protein